MVKGGAGWRRGGREEEDVGRVWDGDGLAWAHGRGDLLKLSLSLVGGSGLSGRWLMSVRAHTCLTCPAAR